MLIHSLPGIEGNISTVLIVGNEDSLRAVLRTLFEECGGFDFCIEATSGSEAIDTARHLLTHLVILDSSLPEMNGFKLVQEIRGIRPRLQNFMLTAEHNLQEENQALSCV